ncbi:hypothetical protein Cfor_05529 [Coptotermes formosanus]|uniref:Uncharacterized protein n=1 Tax=Coptotermes formosanus TaxID=36987 RepID=A0A6L2PNW9_COPFO|nr:hypothetical protein Cfor_05529 [Coptotermes formosanus]
MTLLENINPKLYRKCDEREITPEEEDDNVVDPFDSREVFDMIRGINDPEHPLTLEELNVVDQSLIETTITRPHLPIHVGFQGAVIRAALSSLRSA